MDPSVFNHMDCFGVLCQKYKKYDVEVLTLRRMLSRGVTDKYISWLAMHLTIIKNSQDVSLNVLHPIQLRSWI